LKNYQFQIDVTLFGEKSEIILNQKEMEPCDNR